jgi:hypothetical protein
MPERQAPFPVWNHRSAWSHHRRCLGFTTSLANDSKAASRWFLHREFSRTSKTENRMALRWFYLTVFLNAVISCFPLIS